MRHSSASTRRTLPFVVVAVTLVATVVPAFPYPRPSRLERVSVTSDGTETDGYAAYPAISDDGRYVSFDSQAALVPDDTNGINDVFVHDRLTRRTERVSVATDGTQANDPAYLARISTSGRFVIFQSGARNLVPGDSGVAPDVFIRDLEAGTTERVSINSEGKQANSLSFPGDVSGDGRYVAFESFSSNLDAGDTNGKNDVFVRDRVDGTTERVSQRGDGRERVGDSFAPSISEDGRYVAYTALVGTQGDDNADLIDEMQIFWHDRSSADVRMISVSSDGRRGNGFSSDPQISADGRYVAFVSQAQNLVPADANRASDIFVHDTGTGTTRRVSVTSGGEESNGPSTGNILSSDGRYVTFTTEATDLSSGDTNGRKDVYVHDLLTGATERVSLGAAGEEPTSHSENPFVTAGGRFVAFANYSPLVADDMNGTRDVFVRDRGPALGIGHLSAVRSADEVDVSGWATFSGIVASEATDPSGDAGPGAEQAGVDVTRAEVVYRPESEDLLVRIQVGSMPSVRPPQATGAAIGCALSNACGAGLAGLPSATYGLSMVVEGTSYEVRAERGAAPMAPVLQLMKCETACTPVGQLAGSVGVTGEHVVAVVPLLALGAEPGDRITGLRAWAGTGHPLGGVPAPLDQALLADAELPAPTISVALIPEGVPADQVMPQGALPLISGVFAETLPGSAAHDRVAARACLGTSCTIRVAIVQDP